MVTFEKMAHIIPKSLGGKELCKEVCDNCNHFFGSPTASMPAIELVFKELFNLSRYLILDGINKRNQIGRYKSTFFNINFEKHTIRSKPKYHQKWTQNRITQLLKQGIYKVFLESRSAFLGDAHNIEFDFIREFARYGLNDLPIFYFPNRMQAILFSTDEALNPEMKFTKYQCEVMDEFKIFEFHLMSHEIVIPISKKLGSIYFKEYLKCRSDEAKDLYPEYKTVQSFEDIDFTFSFLR